MNLVHPKHFSGLTFMRNFQTKTFEKQTTQRYMCTQLKKLAHGSDRTKRDLKERLNVICNSSCIEIKIGY